MSRSIIESFHCELLSCCSQTRGVGHKQPPRGGVAQLMTPSDSPPPATCHASVSSLILQHTQPGKEMSKPLFYRRKTQFGSQKTKKILSKVVQELVRWHLDHLHRRKAIHSAWFGVRWTLEQRNSPGFSTDLQQAFMHGTCFAAQLHEQSNTTLQKSLSHDRILG